MAWAEDDVSPPKRREGSAIDKYIIKSLRINLNVHQKVKDTYRKQKDSIDLAITRNDRVLTFIRSCLTTCLFLYLKTNK